MNSITNYIFYSGYYHLIVFSAYIIIISFLKSFYKIKLSVRHVLIFYTILLLYSALVNSLWDSIVIDKLYHSADYTVDYSPFWPITNSVIYNTYAGDKGYLIGNSTLMTINIYWIFFTILNWIITIVTFNNLKKSRIHNAFIYIAVAIFALFSLIYPTMLVIKA